MNYYISDMHLGYGKIIGTSHRPDKSVNEMNERIIHAINQTVNKQDKLYILGDVACYYYNPVHLLKRILCEKILIEGNHDARWLKDYRFRNSFSNIYANRIVHDGEYKIFLSHYPMAEWDGYYKGIYLFYGHIHNAANRAAAVMNLYENAVNVSLDCIQRPRTAEELITFRKAHFQPEVSPEKLLEKRKVEKYIEREEKE